MKKQPDLPDAIACLTEIFERADSQCWSIKQNMGRQGGWRLIRLEAKAGLKALRAPIPETEEARFNREAPERKRKELEQAARFEAAIKARAKRKEYDSIEQRENDGGK